MAQGWRGRAVAVATGLAVTTGLGGCKTDETKTYTPPAAKGTSTAMPAATRTTAPGTGYQPASAVRPAGGTGAFASPNPYNPGAMSTPTVPGNRGQGDPLPGSQSLVPPVGPSTGSQYTPTISPPGFATPASYTTETVGGMAPQRPGLPSARLPEPPPLPLSDVGVLPPPPPYTPGVNPAVGPVGDFGPPAAPPTPLAPLAPPGFPPHSPK